MATHAKQRFVFIDLLRFFAVVAMLQGHTFDALLQPSMKHTWLFVVYDFFHGFVAPAFLFASGVAFGVSTFRKWESHLSLNAVVARRVGRFVGLAIIGYALHLPFFSLSKILTASSAKEIAALSQVDALQCIALTLLFLQAAVFVVRRKEWLALLAAFCSVGIMLASPLLWTPHATDGLPIPLASFLNGSSGSWFPIFPWAFYIMCGVVCAFLFLRANEHRYAAAFMATIIWTGAGLVLAGIVTGELFYNAFPAHDFWKVNPSVLWGRLGFILIATAALHFFEQSVVISSKIPTIMGTESLVIYILHLIILYGSVMNSGLGQTIGGSLGVGKAGAIFLLMLFAMSTFAYVWNVIKKKFYRESVLLKFALAATFLFYFITRPY
ncbi:MAG: heparan-alpha-glucosaminide N-acetyltransferase domain-containing protein [Ignavibacteriales bacterium]|nr:heparan-alpha-glucosaminide N-acetyltransferase domain-containing protein [Ignavibacteriales bacterium]